MTTSALASLIDQVRAARADGTPLDLQGGGTKRFYGEPPAGRPLDLRVHAGVVRHQPTELVVTVACGTPLAELQGVLADAGQALAFEPPAYHPGGTVGGMVAAGLSGPARATAGAVRDHLLGATLLDGRGELMRFGGEVMKNVAGYDVSRVLAGSLGVLGVIAEVSLKVLPLPTASATLRLSLDEAAALAHLNVWGGQPLPLDASTWRDDILFVRLRGAAAAVDAARTTLVRQGGEALADDDAAGLWAGWRDHTDAWFQAPTPDAPLWRLSVPQTAPPLTLPGRPLIEWHGAQRWYRTTASADHVRRSAAAVGGHATLFRTAGPRAKVFTPLSPPLAAIHRSLKQAFDPDRLFNAGRLYPDL